MVIWPGLPVLVYPNVLSTILYQILFTLLNVDYAKYVYNRHCIIDIAVVFVANQALFRLISNSLLRRCMLQFLHRF